MYFLRTVAREMEEARERIEQQRADLEAQAQADVAAIAGTTPTGRRRRRGRRRAERTCVGCRASAPRRTLVRLVVVLDGEVVADLARRRVRAWRLGAPTPACLAKRCAAGLTAHSETQVTTTRRS